VGEAEPRLLPRDSVPPDSKAHGAVHHAHEGGLDKSSQFRNTIIITRKFCVLPQITSGRTSRTQSQPLVSHPPKAGRICLRRLPKKERSTTSSRDSSRKKKILNKGSPTSSVPTSSPAHGLVTSDRDHLPQTSEFLIFGLIPPNVVTSSDYDWVLIANSCNTKPTSFLLPSKSALLGCNICSPSRNDTFTLPHPHHASLRSNKKSRNGRQSSR
jgi:hypothetical protein